MASSDTTIGLWINEKRLIVVECKVSDKTVTLIKSVDADLPPGIINKGQIVDYISLLTFAEDVVAEIKAQTKFASINLMPGSYILKRFELPNDYIKADPELIYFELKQQIIGNEANYYFSHFTSGHQTYAIAAQKANVDIRLKLLSDIGFVPVSIEPAEIILNNVVSFIHRNEMTDVVLIEVSIPYTTIGLRLGGVFYPGGTIITDPELYVSAYRSTIKPIHLEQFIENIKSEIATVFASTTFDIDRNRPEYLVLSGIHPNLTLAMEIENLFDTNIFLREGISKSKHIKMKGKHKNLSFPEMASAIGLSLRRPND